MDVTNANCRRLICHTSIFNCKIFLVPKIKNPNRLRNTLNYIVQIDKNQNNKYTSNYKEATSLFHLDTGYAYLKAKMAI